MQIARKTRQYTIALLIAALMLAQFGCLGETVSALDYSLESDLYSEQTGSTPEQTSAPERDATPTSATPAPERTPTPVPAQSSAAETTSPELSDSDATPQPSQTPQTHRLTIFVQDQTATGLAGARVSLYQDESLLFSGMTGIDGLVSWLLPPGHTYRVTAALSGYLPGDGSAFEMVRDVSAKITLSLGEQTDAGAATPTPIPVPDGAPGKVRIMAAAITIRQKQEGFALLDGVSAQTEFGQPVAVWVVDNGGFRADTAGTYQVIYGAFQEGKLITLTRTITVQGEETDPALQERAGAPSGSSAERYEILLAYRAAAGSELSERVAALNEAYRQKVDKVLAENAEARILAAVSAENDTDVSSSTKDVQQTLEAKVTNWPDVLATFLARYVASEDRPLDAELLRSIPLHQLDSVFWDMNQIEVFRLDGVANVLLNARSYEDMADAYGMSAKRKTFLYELMQPEFQRTFASITGSAAFEEAAEENLQALLSALPEDINIARKEVVETALSLVGKVSYVWGGKYNRLGWNEAWGDGDPLSEAQSAGAAHKKGLDCSGYVSWVFVNATGEAAAMRAIGNGSSMQWANSSAIGWDEGRPGDLAFYNVPGTEQFNHVGIIVAVGDDGNYLVAHCSSLQNGVVVTDGWSTGFRYIRRPVLFR